MGDCGAFSYVRDDAPPYTPDEVIDFYEECGFDLGISVDHVIFGYDPAADHDPDHPQAPRWKARQQPHPGPGRSSSWPQSPQPQGPVRAPGRGPGMEPGLVRLCGPRTAEDRLHADRRSAAWSRSRPRRSSPASRRSARSCEPGTQLHLLGITRCSNMRRVRVLRGHQFRQHLSVPAGIQRRPGQLPHRRPHLHGAARAPGGRQPQARGTDPGRPDLPAARRPAGAGMPARCSADYDAGRRQDRHCHRRPAGVLRRFSTAARTTRAPTTRSLTECALEEMPPAGYAQRPASDVVIFRGSERNKTARIPQYLRIQAAS